MALLKIEIMHKLRVEEMGRLEVAEFKAAEKLPVVMVLDNIRSLHNVGSVFRTADAFRLQRVCLCGITGCPPQQEIHKTALGAEDSVDWQYYPTTEEASLNFFQGPDKSSYQNKKPAKNNPYKSKKNKKRK